MSGRVTLSELRHEMARLAGVLLSVNRKYIDREAEVTRLHAKGANGYTGNLITVLNNDMLLTGYSGTAKTVATLAAGMAAASG